MNDYTTWLMTAWTELAGFSIILLEIYATYSIKQKLFKALMKYGGLQTSIEYIFRGR
jgi:hypothetical protein